MSIRPVHPFPARMAPELALKSCEELETESVVLDPMIGSGTAARHAAEFGHQAIGFDLDPLAVLISKVWTTPVNDQEIEAGFLAVLKPALAIDPNLVELPWIDDDDETRSFIEYWFGRPQIQELRCLAYVLLNAHIVLDEPVSAPVLDVLRVSLSRIIITKEQCASLARDTSHSRPHKVASTSGYPVFLGFERSVWQVRKRLASAVPPGRTSISLGDARCIDLPDNSVDFVLTSPPYLNAIDYLRGHRLSLVWLGYGIAELRRIRSNSIGAERGPDEFAVISATLVKSVGDIRALPRRHQRIIDRYVIDIGLMLEEVARVLKSGGRATFIVGNSCLKGVFIKNSDAVETAAQMAGLDVVEKIERELPVQSRYLPVLEDSALGKRMRTETIISMQAA